MHFIACVAVRRTSCSSSGCLLSPAASAQEPGLPHSTGMGGTGGEGTPHTSSKSNRHPVPAVQPSRSSEAVQSLAPTAWQMASASVKVLSRAHGQPASDAPHTEQPLRRDPQSGESLTSEQHRTWPREGRGEHISARNVIRCVARGHAPRAARLGHGDLQPRCKSPAARIRPGGTKAWSGEGGLSWRQRSSCTTRRASGKQGAVGLGEGGLFHLMWETVQCKTA